MSTVCLWYDYVSSTGGWWHRNWGEQSRGNGWSGISGIPFRFLHVGHYVELFSPQQPAVASRVYTCMSMYKTKVNMYVDG
jgi:hypothetical protein